MQGAMPWSHRWIGNPILSGMLNLLFRSGVSDAHCGLRAIRRDAVPRIGLSSTGMEFASEMVIKASKRGLRIEEVPIIYRPRIGESKLNSFRDALAARALHARAQRDVPVRRAGRARHARRVRRAAPAGARPRPRRPLVDGPRRDRRELRRRRERERDPARAVRANLRGALPGRGRADARVDLAAVSAGARACARRRDARRRRRDRRDLQLQRRSGHCARAPRPDARRARRAGHLLVVLPQHPRAQRARDPAAPLALGRWPAIRSEPAIPRTGVASRPRSSESAAGTSHARRARVQELERLAHVDDEARAPRSGRRSSSARNAVSCGVTWRSRRTASRFRSAQTCGFAMFGSLNAKRPPGSQQRERVREASRRGRRGAARSRRRSRRTRALRAPRPSRCSRRRPRARSPTRSRASARGRPR